MVVKSQEVLYRIEQREALENQPAPSQGPLVKLKLWKEVVAIDTRPTKLFQTRCSFVAVFKVDGPDGEDGPQYILIHGQPLSVIQCLASGSAESLLVALKASAFSPAISQAFDLSVRVSTSDRLAANFKADKGGGS